MFCQNTESAVFISCDWALGKAKSDKMQDWYIARNFSQLRLVLDFEGCIPASVFCKINSGLTTLFSIPVCLYWITNCHIYCMCQYESMSLFVVNLNFFFFELAFFFIGIFPCTCRMKLVFLPFVCYGKDSFCVLSCTFRKYIEQHHHRLSAWIPLFFSPVWPSETSHNLPHHCHADGVVTSMSSSSFPQPPGQPWGWPGVEPTTLSPLGSILTSERPCQRA